MTMLRVCAFLMLMCVYGAAWASTKSCPDVRAGSEPVFFVQVGTRLVRVPWQLTISGFGTSVEEATGQVYDEISFMGETSRSQPFLLTIRTVSTYEKEEEFAWVMVRGQGSPSAINECDYKGQRLTSLTFDSLSTTKSIYEDEEMEIVVYGDHSIELLVELLNLLQDHW
jgi:hypothetical protein